MISNSFKLMDMGMVFEGDGGSSEGSPLSKLKKLVYRVTGVLTAQFSGTTGGSHFVPNHFVNLNEGRADNDCL